MVDVVRYGRKKSERAATPTKPPLNAEHITNENFAHKLFEAFRLSTIKSKEINANNDEYPEESSIKRTCVKNAHELLACGEKSRIFDEIEYLISGMEDARSSSAIEGLLVDLSDRLFTVNQSATDSSYLRGSGILDRIVASMLKHLDVHANILPVLSLVIIELCSDVRRMDYFIAWDRGLILFEMLIGRGTQQLCHDLTSLRWRRILRSKPAAEEPCETVALWILERLLRAHGSEKPNLQLLFDSGAVKFGWSLLHKSDPRSSILLIMLQYGINMRDPTAIFLNDPHNISLLLQHGENCAIIVGLLLDITATDDGASFARESIINDVIVKLEDSIKSNDPTMQILLSSLLSNLVDRSDGCRATAGLRLKETLCACIQSSALASVEARTHLAVLLGIIMSDNPAGIVDLEVKATIRSSFSLLESSLQSQSRLGLLLASQLRSFSAIYV